MAKRTLRMALVGGGMFGRDVVLRSLADVEQFGITPYLATAGLDHRARALADIDYQLIAIGTRTAKTAESLCREYAQWVPTRTAAPPVAVHGESPWSEILSKH